MNYDYKYNINEYHFRFLIELFTHEMKVKKQTSYSTTWEEQNTKNKTKKSLWG